MLLLLKAHNQLYKFIFLSIFIGILSFFASEKSFAQTAPDFSLSVSPSSATIQPGSSVSFSISVTRQGNFNSSVSFSGSAGNGLTVSFSPGAITPPGTVTMVVSASPNINPGNYPINITGSGGGVTRSASASVTVPQQGFTLNASPSTTQVTPGTNATFNISATTPANNRSLSVSLTASGQLGVGFANSTISTPGSTSMTVLVPASTTPGLYTINVIGTASGVASQSASVTVDVRPLPDFTLNVFPTAVSLPAGEQTEIVVSVIGANRFEDVVNLKLDSKIPASLSSNSVNGSGIVSLMVSTNRNTPLDDYPITIIATSSTKAGVIEKRAITTISVTAASDFNLALSPSTIETSPGKSFSFTVSVNALNRFNDIVVLSFNSLNSNIGVSSNVPGLMPGAVANVSVNVGANVLPGTYDVAVIGMAGGLQRSSVFKVIVKGDFDLTLDQPSQSIFAGEKANFVASVSPRDNFTGQISLTANSSENTIQTSFSPVSITSNGISMVTVNTSPNTPAGDYKITISATGGGITKTVTFNLTVKVNPGDFTIRVSPDMQSVAAGKSTSFALDIQGQNGFNGSVNLTAETSGQPFQLSFSSSTVKVGDNVSITVSTNNTTPRGTYNIRVIGTSGQLIKTASFVLTVTPAPEEAFSFALAPSVQDIVIGDSTMYRVGIVGRSGFNQMVDLSATSQEPSLAIAFAKTSLAAGANTSLTVVTSSNTPAGIYPITITGKSGTTTVVQQVRLIVRVAALRVSISFDPPAMGEIAPPRNVQVSALELKDPSIVLQELNQIINPLAESDIAGFKIYRLPQPKEGQPPLTADDLVKDENLIATLSPSETNFVDNVTVSKSGTGNFVYSVSTFFGNGQNSSGSQPMSTNLPVINSPSFSKGTIFIGSAGSFITTGSVIIIDDMDEYPLMFDSSGTLFTVAKKKAGSLTGKTIKKLIPKGATVKLTVRTSEGKLSISRSLTRK
jgi:uncharacterized membrane protein